MPSSTAGFVDYKAVKAAVSIVQILDRYRLTAKLRQSGDSLTGPCPIHNGENATQFRVSISKNCWNCFGKCKRGGNVIDFVSLKEGIGFRDAALRIQEWFTVQSKAPNQIAKPSEEVVAKPASEPKPTTSTNQFDGDAAITENKPLGFALNHLDPNHPYLIERGLTPETIKCFGLGFCSKGVMADRVAIPIHNSEGELVAYAGRWPGQPSEGKPKYKLPKGFKKSIEVFNFHRAAEADPEKLLVVVEGFFDCMKSWQAGLRVVSIMGSSLSDAQAKLLVKLVGSEGRIVLLFDEDDAGREGRAKALSKLAPFVYVKAQPCGSEGTQPDQLSADQLKHLVS